MKGKRIAIGTGASAAAVIAVAAWVGWPHIRCWVLFESISMNVQGFPEYRHRQTGIVFVRLPGGTFWMGAQQTDPNRPNYDPDAQENEGPVHEVRLGAFLIAKHEVTQAQWKRVMGSNPSGFTGDEDRPVEQVSWEDILKFEARTGLALPSEAQWEYACRAGTGTPFAGKLVDLAWFGDNSNHETHPVGTKLPNAFGLHDLHGNVWEWVTGVNDAGSAGRVIRGGSWSGGAGFCRSSKKRPTRPECQYDDLGFRPAWRWPR